MPPSERPGNLPQYVLRNSRGRTTRAPGVFITQLARDTAINASSGSRKKHKRPRLSTEAFVQATRFSLTDDALSITLPIPPSINRQYATVNGRRVLSATGRRYKGAIGQLLMVAASSSDWHAFLRKAQEHGLALTIRFHFPTLLRRDLDGGLKIAQDALCEAMSLNDNRIMEIHLYKTLDRDNPRLECTLSLGSPLAPLSRGQASLNRPLPLGSAQGKQKRGTKGRSRNSPR